MCASLLLIYIHTGRLIRNYLAAINSCFHYCQRLINASETLYFNDSDTLHTKQFYLSLFISLSLFQAKGIPSLKTDFIWHFVSLLAQIHWHKSYEWSKSHSVFQLIVFSGQFFNLLICELAPNLISPIYLLLIQKWIAPALTSGVMFFAVVQHHFLHEDFPLPCAMPHLWFKKVQDNCLG